MEIFEYFWRQIGRRADPNVGLDSLLLIFVKEPIGINSREWRVQPSDGGAALLVADWLPLNWVCRHTHTVTRRTDQKSAPCGTRQNNNFPINAAKGKPPTIAAPSFNVQPETRWPSQLNKMCHLDSFALFKLEFPNAMLTSGFRTFNFN